MVPSPEVLFRYHDEEFIPPVEKCKVVPVLKKVCNSSEYCTTFIPASTQDDDLPF
jgi:hypothetical protein